MKKFIFCLLFIAVNSYSVVYHNLLEAIKSSNFKQLKNLISVAKLSEKEKKRLVKYAKETVDKRQKKIDKRNSNVLLADTMKMTIVGLPLGLYLDSRDTGHLLGGCVTLVGLPTSFALLKRAAFSPSLISFAVTCVGILGCGYLEKYVQRKAKKTDEVLRINHSQAGQIYDFLLAI